MGKKLHVDANGKVVGAGSAEAAFIFNEGDDRLDKFRKGVAARNAAASGKAAPAAEAPAAEDNSTERVGKGK